MSHIKISRKDFYLNLKIYLPQKIQKKFLIKIENSKVYKM